jgi:hypothetical protein
MTVIEMMITSDDGPITVADNDAILRLIETSRVILRAARIRSWNSPISLITDDIAVAHARVPNPMHRINQKKSYWGFCWESTAGHVLWFKNRYHRSRQEITQTLCHEVTHALITTSSHGHSWRRAYAMLLPFWLDALAPGKNTNPINFELHEEVTRVTKKYRPKRQDLTRRDIQREVVDHVMAAEHAWRKQNGLFIPTIV